MMADPELIDLDDLSDSIDQMQVDSNEQDGTGPPPMYDDTTLPNALIITNVDDSVFQDDRIKREFEHIFCSFEASAEITYLRSFRRVRVEYSDPAIAATVRIQMHEVPLRGKRIKCYFSQHKDSGDVRSSSPHLHPPPVPKQFLISPPASPPVGWEPINERNPVVDYELLQALANLAPGEAHEVHPGSDLHPKIIVHICEDPIGFLKRPDKILQTRRPDS